MPPDETTATYEADGDRWYIGGRWLAEVHDKMECRNRPCVIHNPSDHALRGFPLHWRADRSLMERICPHGVGHPDPDHLAAFPEHGVHGCCGQGCCTPTLEVSDGKAQ